MKFKTRLVAGNSIWPAKIRPEGPLSLLKLSCKKKIQKNIPPKKGLFFFGGGGGQEIVVTCAQCVLGC